MSKINNERLPAPNADELHYAKKIYYVTRMYQEVSYEKYGIENIDFAKWITKTFDEYYLNNKHITYAEYKKLL